MMQRFTIDRAILGICWIPAAATLLLVSGLLPGEVDLHPTYFIALGVTSVLIATALIIMGIRQQANRKPLWIGAVIAIIPALFWIYAIGYVAIFGLGH